MSLFHKNTLLGASGAGGAAEALYVDDVFSTFLYRNDTNTERNNGIDLSGEGGLVVTKFRSSSSEWGWTDSERGITKSLDSSTNGAEATEAWISSFDDDGFTTGSYLGTGDTADIVSWTFRKAPGFFDVVTWTGDGTSGRQISHSLGSTPGFITVKKTSSGGINRNWWCWHRSISTGNLSLNNLIILNQTAAAANVVGVIGSVTSASFEVGSSENTNASGDTYVAYIFAHDDQSFGDDSDEAIIKCDSVALPSSGDFVDVNLGFEPQWVLLKMTDFSPTDWFIFDNMRGVATEGAAAGTGDAILKPNTSDAETSSNYLEFTATGFRLRRIVWGSNKNVAYVAIRRPHKPPTAGTDVFDARTASSFALNSEIPCNFAPDFMIATARDTSLTRYAEPRLIDNWLDTSSNAAENTTNYFKWDGAGGKINLPTAAFGNTPVFWQFRRAPGFFDVVAYTGTGANRTVDHNLGAVPELMFIKWRSGTWTTRDWLVYSKTIGNAKRLRLHTDGAEQSSTSSFNSTTPTSSVFTLGTDSDGNYSGSLYVAYLFATLDGISKVGTYSGTGSDVDVDCGFSAGARFVLIKRTDSTGDWYVWDTARGIATGNDPYLVLNTTGTEVTSTDYIDPLNSGFTVTSSAPAALNASGGTYLFLAIA